MYDVADSYQVAFYVAGAIPVIASMMMFTIPFLMPRNGTDFAGSVDPSTWRHHPSSKQYLIEDTSSTSTSSESKECVVLYDTATGNNNNNNNGREANDLPIEEDDAKNTLLGGCLPKRTASNTTYVIDRDNDSTNDCVDGFDSQQRNGKVKKNNNNNNNNNNRYLMACKEDPSFTSIGSLHQLTVVDKRSLSMRGLGSISSFGSVVFSPVSPITHAQSSNLVVIDRVTNV